MPRTNWITEFREKFFTLDEDKRNEAIALKDVHLPKKIYFYSKINDNFWKNVSDIWYEDRAYHSVRLTSPSKFNDPYDTLVHPLLSIPYRKSILSSLRARMGNLCSSVSNPDELEKELERLFDSFLRKGEWTYDDFSSDILSSGLISGILEMYKGVITGYQEKLSCYGIKCFSERFDSILMWSHYADAHKGVCVEYDISQLPRDSEVRRYLYPVIYEDDISSVLSNCSDINHSSYLPLLLIERSLSKASGWRYEKEWRFIKEWHNSPGNNSGLAPYPFPLHPSKIYIGFKTPITDVMKLKVCFQFYNVKFEIMGLKPDSYKLVHHPYM